MTVQLELTVMDGTNPGGELAERLKGFEKQFDVRVHLTILAWETAWADIVKYGLYSHGPDVSEIGSTWLASLVGMNSLRPFNKTEATALEPDAFLPRLWENGLYGNKLYGIPWFADARLIYYRRDILEKAGINPAQAFSSAQELENAVEKLKNAGVDTPWLVPTDRTLNNLHILAAWVWGAGGDFLSPDGKEIMFDQPKSLEGFYNYFRLGRFISARSMGLSDNLANRRFRRDKAAMLVSGPWVRLTDTESMQVVRDNFDVAPLPGIPFIGSSHMVIWKHSPNAKLACKLIEHLTSAQFQREFYHVPSLYPSRHALLQEGNGHSDPVRRASIESISRGRTFPVAAMWGLVEDRLSLEIVKIWGDIAVNAHKESIETIVYNHITTLAERLRLPGNS